MRKVLLSLATGLAAAIALFTTATPAFADSLLVDASNPELECPSADHSSIQTAVAAAAPGDRILVCPGLYAESVVVPKTLALYGWGPAPRVRNGDPTREAIVEHPENGTGFRLDGSGIDVTGFTIQGVTRSGIGISAAPSASGYRIERNYLHRNTTDLALGSDGSLPSVIRDNALNNQSDSPFTASTFAIFGLSGAARITLAGNLITRHQTSPFSPSAAFSLPEQLAFVDNHFVDDGELVISGGSEVLIAHNRIERSNSSGIRVFATSEATIAYNRVDGAVAAGVVAGDFLPAHVALIKHNVVTAAQTGMSIPRSSGVQIEHNRLLGNASDGLRLLVAHENVLSHNHVSNNGAQGINLLSSSDNLLRKNEMNDNGASGMRLASSHRNHLEHNRSSWNALDGLAVVAESNANEIVGNVLRFNLEHDCHDDTVGTRTAGTANTWTKNHGRTENRSGLCERG